MTIRIRDNMLPFFNRLELLGMLFGTDAPWPYSTKLSHAVPPHFMTIREARDSIVHIMNLSLRYIRSMKFRRYEGLISPADSARKEAMQRSLKDWKTAFDEYISTHALNEKDLDATKVLLIHLCVVTVWLDTSTYAGECSSDAHNGTLEMAVRLGEAIQAHAGTREQREQYPTTFLFDMEVVSPIYFVCIKCRHPQIRRRAIALLRQTFRREGLWDSRTYHQLPRSMTL
jgi:hypothetical protein